MAKRPLFHFPSRQASTELASRNVTYQLSVTAPKAIAAKPPDHHRKTDQTPGQVTADQLGARLGVPGCGRDRVLDGVTAAVKEILPGSRSAADAAWQMINLMAW